MVMVPARLKKSLVRTSDDKFITNIQPVHLQEIRIWTDVVREARNAIHFGAKLNTDNNYEKTGMILLASISHFKTIYYLKKMLDENLYTS
ncbi:hypothetical protein [Cytobacillus purgationiresistens]|uniref:DUF4145 domain-containing protein n=1 Tax=Cytobacillus purgationiresistens TaxID=863449 RepID=A0ABU0AQR4_9BACI|nr:hypothetical protein [Cytobacillus purgationiresistens]MDQ0272748.1 hypothetical protein [Cytobacillus purgationiresistens]